MTWKISVMCTGLFIMSFCTWITYFFKYTIIMASKLKNQGSVLALLSLLHHGLDLHNQYFKDKQQSFTKVQIN